MFYKNQINLLKFQHSHAVILTQW